MIKLKLMLGALAAGMAGIVAAYFKGRANAIREQEIERLRKTTEAYETKDDLRDICLLYTSPSPRDRQKSRMPSSA